jgi:hypothetical protein
VVVPRLTDEQLLVLEKPNSDECLLSAGAIIPGDTSSTEDLQQHSQLWLHSCDVPGCTFVGKFITAQEKSAHLHSVHMPAVWQEHKKNTLNKAARG